ncbi:hypothetical protein BJ875DRAFT_506491 [Amylocarpus encephaloides]|uniref:Uncharacterized protein n=1 Tax=Amylocarpus encephaloides TaxID=45428 RepID=A0A9P7YDM3_9HELO|nr:hypothetical protein BJ875DRAFT_506491 [Amylocarpus encephaloides]
MNLQRQQLEIAASDVIQILKGIPEFAACKVAVIGGLALWNYMPAHRATEDVDFIINIDSAPASVKSGLLALPNSRFIERAQFFYYIAQSGNIQIDMTPQGQSPYFPAAARALNTIASGTIPYISATDLIKRLDVSDAEELLMQEIASGSLRLTPQQIVFVKEGLGRFQRHQM